MKTAIYIEDGRTQFVLTAETSIDKQVLSELQSTSLKTYRGTFYGCNGGWIRWEDKYPTIGEKVDDSLIFVVEKHTQGSE